MNFLLLFLLITSTTVLGVTSLEDQKRVFRLCYSQMTNKRVLANHSIYSQVASGSITGARGCVKLLQSSYLGSNNKISTLPNGEVDWEKQKVIQTFFDIHHQPFVKIFGQRKVYFWDSDSNTNSLHNESEMAMHFVYSIFKQNIPFSDSVTRNFPVQGIRYTEATKLYPYDVMLNVLRSEPARSSLMGSHNNFEVCLNKDGSECQEYGVIAPQFKQGFMIGVEPKAMSPGSPPFFKAGALGAPAYIFLNLPATGSPIFKGGIDGSPRNFSASFYREFLCRDLPVIRPTDASAFIRNDAAEEFTFSNNAQCIQCHASIEPMTYIMRNKRVNRIDVRFKLPAPGGEKVSTPNAMSIQVFEPSTNPSRRNLEPEGEMVTQRYEWFKDSIPVGRLRFRSAMTGAFVDEKVIDFEGLGQELANQDDFYACSMKRYLEYFTGLKAPIFDDYSGNQIFSAFQNPFDTSLRSFIYELANDLKNHPNQDLVTVLEKLFNNEIYLRPERGVIKEL